MNENKGLLASICGFFKSLFSSSPASDESKATPKANDGLTSVERYIRNKAQKDTQLTGVEKYIRNKVASNKPLTGVERYIRSQSNDKPLTGVERYIRNKG